MGSATRQKHVIVLASLLLCLLWIAGCGHKAVAPNPTPPPVQPPSVVTPSQPEPPGLMPMSEMPAVTGRWELSDGTVLLEGGAYSVYARYYPTYDKIQGVMWDSAGARVKDIKDGQIVFICTQTAPNAVKVFPYTWVYDMKQMLATTKSKVYLPLAESVKFGDLYEETAPITAENISLEANSVFLQWRSQSEVVPPIEVTPLVEEKKMLIRLKGVSAAPTLQLPTVIDGGDSLVRSVVVEDGVSGTGGTKTSGLTLTITVAEDKWAAATYDCLLDARDNGSVRLNLYIDKTPTDLTPTVKR